MRPARADKSGMPEKPAAATADPGERLPAVAAFLVAASGVSALGIGAAFWALLAGLAVRTVLRPRDPRAAEKPRSGRHARV